MYWVRTILDQWDVIYLFFTGESSILDAPIQAGDPAYDYLVTVRVRIFDIYGDNGTFSTEITVTIKLICYPLQCISCQNQEKCKNKKCSIKIIKGMNLYCHPQLAYIKNELMIREMKVEIIIKI